MKKLIMLTAIILAGFTSASAGNGKSISSAISKQLNVPASLKSNKLNEKVNVQFSITSEGNATVVNIETKNIELKNYIISQFPKIVFNDASKQAGMYFIDINFKVL